MHLYSNFLYKRLGDIMCLLWVLEGKLTNGPNPINIMSSMLLIRGWNSHSGCKMKGCHLKKRERECVMPLLSVTCQGGKGFLILVAYLSHNCLWKMKDQNVDYSNMSWADARSEFTRSFPLCKVSEITDLTKGLWSRTANFTKGLWHPTCKVGNHANFTPYLCKAEPTLCRLRVEQFMIFCQLCRSCKVGDFWLVFDLDRLWFELGLVLWSVPIHPTPSPNLFFNCN